MIKLGIIGYGSRGSGLGRMMETLPFGARVVAIADPDGEGVRRQMARREKDPSTVRLYDEPEKMLDAEELDGVIVATRCSRHAELGVKVLGRRVPLYLEKPVATTLEDYARLAQAERAARAAGLATMVSFPLRVMPVARKARQIIASGQLGAITHVQATNNVPYGEVYFQSWYRDESETGGLFLQKATHDIDGINALLGEPEPAWVAAMSSKLVFRGDRPAGLRCVDCDQRLVCPESKFNPTMSTGAALQTDRDNYRCAFAVDTGNEDGGNLIVEYETGVQANYTQNFYSRRGSACRKVRCIGHLGSLELDYGTGQATVWAHHANRVEQLDCRVTGEGHGGGDSALAINFLQCVLGQAESDSPLSAGLRSVLICLLARESARTRTFQSAAGSAGG